MHLTPDPISPTAYGAPPRMRIQLQRVTCDEGHVSDVEIVLGAPVEVTIASIMAAFCQECGSRNLFFGGSDNDAPPAGGVEDSQ